MQWSRRLLAIGSVLVLVAGCSGPAEYADPSSDSRPTTAAPSSVRAELSAIAGRYRVACRSPGSAVGLRTRDGKRHFAIDGEFAPGVQLRSKSQFLAGSVTKLFVATLSYQLVGARRLSLDDSVDDYLPDWPRGDRITIRMLLGHRSGMGNFGNDFGDQLRDLVLADLARVFTYDEVLALVREIPPVAEPGTAYDYSNANAIVLGAILQRVSHRSLGTMMRARIFEPLHLERTIYGPDDLRATGEIEFHGLYDVVGDGHPIDIGSFPRAAALTVDPAGAGLFSTLPDLLTFTHALFATNRLLPAPARAAVSESVSTLSARSLLLDHSYVIEGHGGASPGAQTVVAFDSMSGTTVAVWCNRLDPGANELLASVIAAGETMRAANSATHR